MRELYVYLLGARLEERDVVVLEGRLVVRVRHDPCYVVYLPLVHGVGALQQPQRRELY